MVSHQPMQPASRPGPEARNLASINEMLAELIRGIADGERPDPGWVQVAIHTLKEHSWRLGFEFFGERPSATWLDTEDEMFHDGTG